MIFEYRNPVFHEDGGIICEINHPDHGWVETLVHDHDNKPFFEKIQEDGEVGEYVAPIVPPTTDADRVLTRVQFTYLLAITGFDDAWSKLEDAVKFSPDKTRYATLKAERDRSYFRLDKTLSIVAQFRSLMSSVAPEVDLSEDVIRSAWDQAEAF